eukprot:g45578.t1
MFKKRSKQLAKEHKDLLQKVNRLAAECLALSSSQLDDLPKLSRLPLSKWTTLAVLPAPSKEPFFVDLKMNHVPGGVLLVHPAGRSKLYLARLELHLGGNANHGVLQASDVRVALADQKRSRSGSLPCAASACFSKDPTRSWMLFSQLPWVRPVAEPEISMLGKIESKGDKQKIQLPNMGEVDVAVLQEWIGHRELKLL